VDSALTLEEALEQLFETFQAVVPYDRMGCALVDAEGQTARSIWLRSTSPEVQIGVDYSARLEGSSLQDILASGRPRILNDLEAHLREHPDSENARRIVAEGMRSSLTCPVIAMGKPVGFLFFSSTRPHTYDDAHVEIYLRVAEHLSFILEKARLYQQLIEAKREVEVRNRLIAEVFGRYTSEAIVSQLLESPEGLKMGGETRKVTVLFADLCGFTPLCAALDPQRVVRLLNIFLGAMADVIMGHRGTIDEFLGDAILAIFGAPVFAVDDARRALACSIAMQRAMDGVNRRLSDEGLPAVEMGIAVHTGEVVVGNIGSSRRAKYGVVGAAVNLATRMETYTAGGQILCSEDTLREVGDIVDFDERVEIGVKGLSEPVQAFSVRGLRDEPESSLPPRSQ
jgi:class 3 adenylate cyclase